MINMIEECLEHLIKFLVEWDHMEEFDIDDQYWVLTRSYLIPNRERQFMFMDLKIVDILNTILSGMLLQWKNKECETWYHKSQV